jgi:hypothetical protein
MILFLTWKERERMQLALIKKLVIGEDNFNFYK